MSELGWEMQYSGGNMWSLSTIVLVLEVYKLYLWVCPESSWVCRLHCFALSRLQLLLPLSYFGKIPADYQATVHGVAKCQTRLSDFTSLHFTSSVSRGSLHRGSSWNCCQEHCLLGQKMSSFCEDFYEKYLFFFFFSAKSCIFRQLIYLYLLGTNECVTGNFSFSCTAIRNLSFKLGEGNGNPFQSSCLENPVDRGTWRAAVHTVAQSQTWLKRHSSSSVKSVANLWKVCRIP